MTTDTKGQETPINNRKDGGPALGKETTRVARMHGCDRAVFTVCWGEHERGETCRCKEDARANLAIADIMLAERNKQ